MTVLGVRGSGQVWMPRGTLKHVEGRGARGLHGSLSAALAPVGDDDSDRREKAATTDMAPAAVVDHSLTRFQASKMSSRQTPIRVKYHR